jgi:hypothetical protein
VLATREKVPITLHLPCAWDSEKKKFVDNGSRDWRVNPGYSANKYHKEFSAKTGRKSLSEIHELVASSKNVIKAGTGFHERNSHIARSEVIIAFSWGKDGIPSSKGTADTWKKAKANSRRIHVCLEDFSVHDSKLCITHPTNEEQMMANWLQKTIPANEKKRKAEDGDSGRKRMRPS